MMSQFITAQSIFVPPNQTAVHLSLQQIRYEMETCRSVFLQPCFNLQHSCMWEYVPTKFVICGTANDSTFSQHTTNSPSDEGVVMHLQ
jgi:hypothetical protein